MLYIEYEHGERDRCSAEAGTMLSAICEHSVMGLSLRVYAFSSQTPCIFSRLAGMVTNPFTYF
jgi:hypothetical protein